MNEPTLTRRDAPGDPQAAILMLHGGTQQSTAPVNGRSASWLRSRVMQAAISSDAHEVATSVWLLRYRRRGWNGGHDVAADARWALAHLRETLGDVPVVLLGHSMGARVAVHVADDPSVVGVVGLAPWWSPQDPVETLTGRTLVAAHGRRDRITSFKATSAYVDRARHFAAAVTTHDMGAAGHYMLTGASAWNEVALESSRAMLTRG